MGYINSYGNYSGTRFGEPQPQPQPRPPLLDPGLQLQMPPFETIMGYRSGVYALSGPQLERVRRVADFVASSWRGAGAITQIRITGYLDARESQSDLGQQRANAVRDAFVNALHQQSPGLATRIFWITEDRGLSQYAKVEIYLWAGPTPMPVPPLRRIPSPAETASR
jgi:outer membrane protein OmpA-like peptidoglycan-associated protein